MKCFTTCTNEIHVPVSHNEKFCPLCAMININHLSLKTRDNLMILLKEKENKIKELKKTINQLHSNII